MVRHADGHAHWKVEAQNRERWQKGFGKFEERVFRDRSPHIFQNQKISPGKGNPATSSKRERELDEQISPQNHPAKQRRIITRTPDPQNQGPDRGSRSNKTQKPETAQGSQGPPEGDQKGRTSNRTREEKNANPKAKAPDRPSLSPCPRGSKLSQNAQFCV